MGWERLRLSGMRSAILCFLAFAVFPSIGRAQVPTKTARPWNDTSRDTRLLKR